MPILKQKYQVPEGNRGEKIRILPVSQDGALSKELIFNDPKLWTAETPSLYRLKLVLYKDDEPMQTIIKDFGIRKTTIDGNVFKLNDVAFKL